MTTLALTLALVPAASALETLERLDRELVTAEARLLELEAERGALVVEIGRLAAERATADVRKREAADGFGRRLRALARMPAGARALVLGGTRSLAEYLDTERALRWIATHDRALHARYVDEGRRLAELGERLAERQSRLEAAAAEARAQRDRRAASRQERVALVDGVLRDRERAVRTASEQRLAHTAVAATLKRLAPATPLSESFAKNRGRLPWPAAGSAGAGFGDRIDARFGGVVSHPGLDVLATAGAPVQAVGPGRVAYAGWLKGYGQIVIIDHGHDYHTLYAHLASTRAQVGDAVVAGSLIGTVGDTGSLSGTHLYFEVRRDGTPEDPARWLRP